MRNVKRYKTEVLPIIWASFILTMRNVKEYNVETIRFINSVLS